MRQPFNNAIDLYNGPSTGSPGTIRVSNVPCRIVPDAAFREVSNPLDASEAYITMDEAEPFGPTWTEGDIGIWEVDIGKGDEVAIHGAMIKLWSVVRVELRQWEDGTDYWRAHVAPIRACPELGCEEYLLVGIGAVLSRVSDNEWEGAGWTLSREGDAWFLQPIGSETVWTTELWIGCGESELFAEGNDPITIRCLDEI